MGRATGRLVWAACALVAIAAAGCSGGPLDDSEPSPAHIY